MSCPDTLDAAMQGTPVIGADVLENPTFVELVGQLWQLRRKLARLLTPHSFDIERDLRWYGADSGKCSVDSPTPNLLAVRECVQI